MNPHTPTTTQTPTLALPLHAALTRVGAELAERSRREQGLPPHVEDAEAVAGFVELWQRPRLRRTHRDSDVNDDKG
jgi:hypothetical protein